MDVPGRHRLGEALARPVSPSELASRTQTICRLGHGNLLLRDLTSKGAETKKVVYEM